ncbi:MAG: protein kinase [Candidatus Promineifilaceae bacterium]|nr:protein kinase [Candidatus Promineifilaceae bacterium]
MSTLSLTLLGPFQAHLGSRPLPGFRTSKVQALLIYLAVEPEPHSRESLMTLLWPGMPERSARHNLRQILYYLRGAIPDLRSTKDGDQEEEPLLLSNRQTIQLNPDAEVLTDIERFGALIDSTQQHDHLDLISCQSCRQELEEGVALYQGDFLADFYLEDSSEFEDWAQIKREAYRRQVLDALEILTAMAMRRQDYPLGRSLAERQLEIDNLRESSYRQLMEVLALSGRREEALAVYDACRRLLAEELAMEPSRRTTEVYEQIVAGNLSFDTLRAQGVRGFEIKEQIGAGAYGTIHRAVQPSIGREVAVKVIRRRYANNPEFIRRFEEEAQTVARLEHPYVVPLYDYWRDPDGAYLVMRYMKGGSLLSALRSGPWNSEPAVQLVEQIASALSAAHDMGIVHRDIKPANILLDHEGNAYLSDFGIAKALEGERALTSAGGVLGTPDYISPEQILNEQVGPRSDQYSLGAVLFETLTGERPFGTAPVANLIYKHLNEPFPHVAESRPDLPEEVDAVIQKATAKRPADRYEHVRDLAEAFRRATLGSAESEGMVVPAAIPSGVRRYNPYKGLRAFQEADAEDFFGRDALIDRLVARLMPGQHAANGRDVDGGGRFLAVVGPSGSGKSSAVKAGLIPALRAGAIPGSEKWFVAEMVPGTHPLEELEMALWPVAVDPPPSLVEPMERDVRGMLRTLRRILPDEPEAQLLLVIDQFEELFTLVEDEDRRAFFLESLLVAASAARSPLRVVVTLRADFYDRPLQLPSLGQLIKDRTELMLPLSAEELTWAVREPARRVGVALEAGLTTVIVTDVVEQPGALPMLQYALTELFERRQGNQLTHGTYQEIGGVRGALSRRAETIYAEFDAQGRDAARLLFLRLVSLGEGVADTRRRLLRAELESIANPQLSEVIDAFAAARLLTLDRDPLTRAPTVAVAHEALLGQWERLRGWLDESRDDVRLQQQLARAAGDWLAADADDSYLLRGARLAQFEAWADSGSLALTEQENDFLDASLAARQSRREAEEARRRRELEVARQLADTEKARAEAESGRAEEQARAAHRLRRRAYILVGVLALAVVMALAAILFGRDARINASLAQSRELAAASLLNQDTNPELALLLATQALSTAETNEAEQALHLALLASRVRQRLVGHEEAIQRLAYSPDGRLIALAAHSENRATLWDAASGRLLHEFSVDWLWGVHFDSEGRRLAASGPGDNFTLAVWDTETGEQRDRLRLPVPTARIGFYALHPDWTQAALWLRDDVPSVWDLEAGERLFDLPGHAGPVELEYSKDGRRLVSYDGARGLVQVWDVRTGELIRSFESGYFINDHAVSPDGRRVALAVNAETAGWQVHVWDVDAPSGAAGPTVRMTGQIGTIRLVDFSADGQMVASASRDGTSRVWDTSSGETLLVLAHGAHVRSVAFHPEGHSLISGDLTGVARIWDISAKGPAERVALQANQGLAWDADLSPDGRTLVTGGIARLWDLDTGEELRRLIGHRDEVTSVAFHPNGGQVATSSIDGTARVWDAATGEQLLTLADHDAASPSAGGLGGVLQVNYDPDGRRLVTAGADRTARIWDSESGKVLTVLEGHREALTTAVFSPDGRYVATGQESGVNISDGTQRTIVQIWDADTGQDLFSFDAGHGQRLWGLAFSTDGRFLVTSGTDNAAKIWALDFEAGRAELAAELTSHTNTVVEVTFSPDGRLLATGTGDDVRLWDVASLSDSAAEIEVVELLALPGGGTMAFSPDGSELISGGRDGLMRVYLLDPAELLAVAQARLTRWWTENECRQYLHSASCPAAPGG